MNRPSIGTLAFIALATFAVSFALKHNSQGAIDSETPAGLAPIVAVAGTTGMRTVADPRRPGRTDASPAAEFPEGPDTTGLLQESLTVDDLLELADADTGGDSEPVDRSTFAALLKSDPELRRVIAN
jgi:hypothetical protein